MNRTISVAAKECATRSYVLHDEAVQIAAETDTRGVIILRVFGCVDVHVALASGAKLTVVCLQTERAALSQSADVGEGASILWQNVSLAAGEHRLASRLCGRNARSDIDWIFYACGDESQNIKAENTFVQADGAGEITMRGVVEDHANVRCEGMIVIEPGGAGTNAFLTENVLMLDPEAKVDAVPSLKITTNDVRASHAATVTRVAAEDLFYFAARGIAQIPARQMYVQGFLSDLTKRIADTTLRNDVVAAIETKFCR